MTEQEKALNRQRGVREVLLVLAIAALIFEINARVDAGPFPWFFVAALLATFIIHHALYLARLVFFDR